jgi:nicotinamidase-related amidase
MPMIKATPFDYNFDADSTALICIDMQRDFCLPGGFGESLGNNVSLIAPAIPVVAKLIEAFRKARLPIIHTKECHKPDLSDLPVSKMNRGNPKLKIGDMGPMGRILIDGEEGSDFVPECAPKPGELVISKPGKDAFYGTNLREYLTNRAITHLVFTGCTTEVCVQTSMRCANDRGYDCLLVEDGTESYFPEFKAMTIKSITAQGGIVGWSCTHEKVLEAIRSL